mgnify:CR=1 FL=1
MSWTRKHLLDIESLSVDEINTVLETAKAFKAVGERAIGVYDMVIHCVEKPLLESVLHRVKGNQTDAAKMLGINRNTLRKKMRVHGIKL